ncbi:MAG TPA: polyribonucleotide nucleotidyltransferase [Firmicutes bacterium]|jgi:polyribonucleotide nucleotidyltransferase|nr:polyribonucleotide nucleotidyltransferase [Bacillota bacterium]
MNLAGRILTIETGKIAKQANGSVLIRYGDTALLVTATVSKEPREGVDFFPLTVDFEERLYAVGRIPGGFIKREGRPTEKAILAARLTDRPLRPLFPKGFRNAVHVVVTVFSVDQDCPPEPLAIIGASAALSISEIPFDGPIAAVNVGLIDGEPIINPTVEQAEVSRLNLVVAGTNEAILMVEAKAKEVSEEQIIAALLAGHEEIKKIIQLQNEMVRRIGREKMEAVLFEADPGISEEVESYCEDKFKEAFKVEEKLEREAALDQVKSDTIQHFLEQYPENEPDIKIAVEKMMKNIFRSMIINENRRPDGRVADEIRPISSEVQLFKRTHGSSLFTRGQTQVLNICTLGALRDMQRLDGLGIEESKRFMHHYNFPPYSVGEVGFMRGPGRREIGHGALAEKALEPLIPGEDDFPYTIRLVSEVVESNGSTSMGSVCAGTLSLMDAGVPIKAPVAGIAMGLIKEGEKYVILSDIQGIEDFLGDMDFKVAGTRSGITALQMDIKIQGLSSEILREALHRAKEGYLFIMDKMLETIKEPRPNLSVFAPRIITIQIEPDKIRDVIGPGGRIINKIIAETGAEIDIEPDGKIFIVAADAEVGQKAQEMIEDLTEDVEPGRIYLGKVTRTEKYGAFVEILPGKEGLVHISHLDRFRVDKTESVVNVGDQIMVKVLDIDDKGRINLSRKEALPQDPAEPAVRGKHNNKDEGVHGNRKRARSNRRFKKD